MKNLLVLDSSEANLRKIGTSYEKCLLTSIMQDILNSFKNYCFFKAYIQNQHITSRNAAGFFFFLNRKPFSFRLIVTTFDKNRNFLRKMFINFYLTLVFFFIRHKNVTIIMIYAMLFIWEKFIFCSK